MPSPPHIFHNFLAGLASPSSKKEKIRQSNLKRKFGEGIKRVELFNGKEYRCKTLYVRTIILKISEVEVGFSKEISPILNLSR